MSKVSRVASRRIEDVNQERKYALKDLEKDYYRQ